MALEELGQSSPPLVRSDGTTFLYRPVCRFEQSSCNSIGFDLDSLRLDYLLFWCLCNPPN